MLQPRQRLLVVTRHCPFPENDGAGAYLFDLLSHLKHGGAVIDLLWLQPDHALYRRGVFISSRRFHAVARLHLPGAINFGRWRFFPSVWWLPFKARSLHFLKTLLCMFPAFRQRFARRAATRPASPSPATFAWSALPSRAETQAFRALAARIAPDAVLINYCWLMPLAAEVPYARRMVLTHDVASHRLRLTGAARSDLPRKRNPAHPEGEAALLADADAILAISDEDAAVFRGMHPTKTVLTVPKAAPLPAAPSPASTVAGRCLFVGGRNAPNEEGLRWFLDRVWPRVRAAWPEASLHVCGGVCEVFREPREGVVFRGRVENLAQDYAAAEAVVVPLLRGTGMKIKLVEAASHGKACVTTPVGLQGLKFFEPAVLCASAPDAFASAMVRILASADLRTQLGRDLQAAAARHLSPEACYNSVKRWLQIDAAPAAAPAAATLPAT